MKREQINKLAMTLDGRVTETHISWVIVSQNLAFKIKKPVKLSFLNFTTLSLRRKYCKLELQLNQKWSDIYLDVSPILFHRRAFFVGGSEGKIVDYAVVMKRLDERLRMDRRLRGNDVSPFQIKVIARLIARVHAKSKITKRPFSIKSAGQLFNDIEGFVKRSQDTPGPRFVEVARRSVAWSNEFLKEHQTRFSERIFQGSQRDVHGDLHSANIFLADKPIIFDCLEFSSRYRQIDVLYEVAFLAMDLEAFGRPDLAKVFVTEYQRIAHQIKSVEDWRLLHYFKCLRANVRAKVHLIQASQSPDKAKVKFHSTEARRYLRLMSSYINHPAT